MNLANHTRRPSWWRLKSGFPLHFGAPAFVVLVCLVIIGSEGFGLYAQRQKEMADARQETSNLARSLSQHAGDTFRTADASIVGAAHRLQMDGVSAESVDQLTKIMNARLAMFPALANWLIVGNAAGCLATGRPLQPADCATIAADSVDYYRTHADDTAHLGAPMPDASGGWLIPLSRRFNNPDGSFAGVIVAAISGRYFQSFYDTFKLGEHGAILLAMVNGTLLVRRPFEARNVGRDLHNSSLFRTYLTQSPNGDVEIRSSTDGVTRLNSYRRIDGYPLVVSVAFASADILKPWRAAVRSQLTRTGALVFIVGALGMWLAWQIRTRQRLEAAYHKATAALRELAESSTDLIVQVSPKMERVYVSPASRRLLGYEPEEMLGHRTDDILYPDDRALWEKAFGDVSARQDTDIRATYRVFRKDGKVIWVEVNRRHLADDEGFVIATRDVTERKEVEEQLAEANRQLELIANEDALTTLANRRHFDVTLDTEFRRAQRDGSILSVIMIDVDKFKLFNDRYGHPAGDDCLRDVGGVLKQLPRRPGDLVARYGGEELVIVLPNTPASGAVAMAERARAAVRSLGIAHEGNQAKIVTISLGVASLVSESGITSAAELMQAADRALYAAKEGGRDRVCLATEAIPKPLAIASD
ncbi:MAG TPA: diguanylate cyclase [Stellaceae bacterium]|jgi:diguanylate cyclase (GGDEF)-like protein/PAS domain S-box-containing protein|nr:diguanylate cyclase [Stellaceae bacterium]